MKVEELKEMTGELVLLLQELEKLIPGKIDPELISFLISLDQHPWQYELLLNALAASRAAKGVKR